MSKYRVVKVNRANGYTNLVIEEDHEGIWMEMGHIYPDNQIGAAVAQCKALQYLEDAHTPLSKEVIYP
jgi:hypothetical protein